MSTVTVAVIGCGRIARDAHFPALSKMKDVKVKYACDLIVEKAQSFKEKYPDLLRGAPTGTAAKFVLTQFVGVNLFDNSDFACLQIPTSYDLGIEVYLNKKTIIKRAHRRNVAVQYWTINDADEMRELIELGCDCIMTDNPELLSEVLDEYR